MLLGILLQSAMTLVESAAMRAGHVGGAAVAKTPPWRTFLNESFSPPSPDLTAGELAMHLDARQLAVEQSMCHPHDPSARWAGRFCNRAGWGQARVFFDLCWLPPYRPTTHTSTSSRAGASTSARAHDANDAVDSDRAESSASAAARATNHGRDQLGQTQPGRQPVPADREPTTEELAAVSLPSDFLGGPYDDDFLWYAAFPNPPAPPSPLEILQEVLTDALFSVDAGLLRPGVLNGARLPVLRALDGGERPLRVVGWCPERHLCLQLLDADRDPFVACVLEPDLLGARAEAQRGTAHDWHVELARSGILVWNARSGFFNEISLQELGQRFRYIDGHPRFIGGQDQPGS